jgi:hypothetical protein
LAAYYPARSAFVAVKSYFAASEKQVPRLRKIIRFANDLAPLGMTEIK